MILKDNAREINEIFIFRHLFRKGQSLLSGRSVFGNPLLIYINNPTHAHRAKLVFSLVYFVCIDELKCFIFQWIKISLTLQSITNIKQQNIQILNEKVFLQNG